MNSIDDLRELLKQKEVTYPDLLNILILLEREHATIYLKVQAGIIGEPEKNLRTAWAMARLADRIRIKVEKKLNE